jgi:hypothetical protein
MPLTGGDGVSEWNPRVVRSLAALLIALGLAAQGGVARASDKEACVVAHEQAQELRRASKLLEARDELVACSQSSCPALVRADCAPWLNDVDNALPSVVVTARDASGTEITDVRMLIDGAPVGERLDGRAIGVDPGEHRFRFEHGLSAPIEQRVVIREGEKSRTMAADFGPPVERAAQRHGGVLPFLLAGAGGVALGSFAYFGVKGKIDADACHGHCTDAQSDPVSNELRLADISLVGGLLLTAAAVWVYFASPPPPAAPSSAVTRDGIIAPRLAAKVRCEVSDD